MFNIKRFKSFFAAVALCGVLLMPGSVHAAAYRVVPGDTLYGISRVFNTSVSSVMSSNNLTGTLIYPGQTLNVPGAAYTVKSGDTMYLIAKRYGISLTMLQKANNEWDSIIYPGQKLVLPGVASTQTQTAANSTVSRSTEQRAVIPYTASDLDLLARLIRAEAENQPYSAKVAVGAVVVNRVKSSDFPNSITGVIYQKNQYYYQFTPVENGFINRAASEEDKKAAFEALHGSDPTKGAIFYFDDSATNKWLWSRPIAIRIGNMVYTY